MNVKYSLHNIAFEWDSSKAAANLRKHSVTFELACEAFFDPFVCYLDDEVIEGELRETIIGLSANWQLLYVVYVMRDDMIRLISARLVTNPERETYENQ
ncbi:MAG: BrnT family toxin [Anaerolineales bacterium]